MKPIGESCCINFDILTSGWDLVSLFYHLINPSNGCFRWVLGKPFQPLYDFEASSSKSKEGSLYFTANSLLSLRDIPIH